MKDFITDILDNYIFPNEDDVISLIYDLSDIPAEEMKKSILDSLNENLSHMKYEREIYRWKDILEAIITEI